MSFHEQFAEDLASYAVGSLPEEARGTIEAHLHECTACRHELEDLRDDLALLALSTAAAAPPRRARARLLDAVALEP